MWLAVIIMLGIGILIGAWQAFWIAFAHVPPFITTLSGMLVFRDLSNVVLNGQTLSINKCEEFVRLFGDGANCYVPDIFSGVGMRLLHIEDPAELKINILALIVGAIVVLLYIVLTLKNRISRKSKSYEIDPLAGALVKIIIISAVIVFFTYKLAKYKGILTALIWIAIVVLIYSYILFCNIFPDCFFNRTFCFGLYS